jgi:hypothetical protein
MPNNMSQRAQDDNHEEIEKKHTTIDFVTLGMFIIGRAIPTTLHFTRQLAPSPTNRRR